MTTVDAGIGECSICCETVPFVKLLDCSHALCKACAIRLLLTQDTETSIRCPHCRNKTIFNQHTTDDYCIDQLRSCYFGHIKCNDCSSNIDIIDTLFCHKCLIVTKHLKRSIEIDPIAAHIKQSLINRYGTIVRNIDDNSINNPIAMQQLIANVLQLSGIDQSCDTVPIDNCQYRIRFVDSAELVAERILQTIVITKEDKIDEQQQQSIIEQRVSINDHINHRNQLDLTTDGQTIAICIDEQLIYIYSMHTSSIIHRYQPISNQSIKSIAFTGDNHHLLVASQSTHRHYNWMLHIYNLESDQPLSYPIDIDHDDRVQRLILSRSTGIDNSYFYLRQCDNRVCQIWMIRITKSNRLKDRLVYERGESQYESLQAINASKYCCLIAWDRVSCCLHRLIIQNNRCCSLIDRLIINVNPIPFAIDMTNRHICCYDSHTKRFVHDTNRSVDNTKCSIELSPVVEYKHQQRRLIRTMSTINGAIYALAIDDDGAAGGNLFMITINKLDS